ncbi:hypothetical protein SAMN05661086_03195 [Anaeromicropila populeti]|uniref:Uncharacterized protein n=1 Tax=Anaeromicropila populeti TaxID=37658 RepID=A0A1I6LBR6_9FIRM|nr:hypothetical protein SAMN05661086_03195 [Anaeromicropila populeti]
MRRLTKSIADIMNKADYYSCSFIFTVIITAIFACLDLCISDSIKVVDFFRILITYMVPSLNTLFLSYFLFENFKNGVRTFLISLSLCSIIPYIIYLKFGNNIFGGIIFSVIFFLYYYGLNLHIYHIKDVSDYRIQEVQNKVSG